MVDTQPPAASMPDVSSDTSGSHRAAVTLRGRAERGGRPRSRTDMKQGDVLQRPPGAKKDRPTARKKRDLPPPPVRDGSLAS